LALAGTLLVALAPALLPGAEPSGTEPEPSRSRVITSGATTVTPGLLESKLKAVDAATDLDEAAKGKLAEQYRKALSHLEAAKSFEAKVGTFAKSLTDAPTETARLRARQDAEPETPAPTVVAVGDDLKTIEQRLAKLMAETAIEEARLGELDKVLEAAAHRPADVLSRLADIKQKLDQVGDPVAAGEAQGEDPDLAQARLWARQSERSALLAEGRMLDQELASLDVRTDLFEAQRDQSVSALKALRSRQGALEAAANQRRLASAEQAKAEAEATETAVREMAPQVQELARGNTTLGAELTEMTKAMERIDHQRTELQTEAKRLEEDFRNVRQRLDVAGTTAVLGPILDDKRRQLPDPHSFRKAIAERETRIANTALAEIRYREELRQLRDLDAYLEQTISGVAAGNRDQVRAELEPLAKRRIHLIEQTQGTSSTLVRGLSELNFLSSELLKTVEAYDAYLAERLLWVRSVLPLNRISILGLGPAIGWLLSPANWGEVLQTLAYQATHSPLAWILGLAFLALLGRAPFLRRDIRATAEPLRKIRTDAFAHTLKAIALSALVAAPVSLLLVLVGWQLATSTEASAFAKQVGLTLISLAVVLYNLRSFRVLCMPGGVADKHFRWPGDVVARLHRVFGWAVHFALPFGFVAQFIYVANDPALSGSLGRLSVLILALALALLLAYLLHPTRGVFKYILAERPNGWANRLRNLWYPLIIAVPVTLAGLALSGYLHAAGVLLESITHTFWLALGLMMVHQSIARWLLVTRRSLALQAALD
ncbi:MAG: mechanosensitive ion channel protein MscS, partial [Chromatiaceae bacterium]